MNGVFWLKSVEPVKANNAQIANWFDVGKIKLDPVHAVIERDLIYPLVRGRDVHRWTSRPSVHILLTQDPTTRTGIPEGVMKRQYPLTHQYLCNFADGLKKRPGYIKYFNTSKDPFWTVYNIGPYSVAPHRVVFKELTDFFQCAVLKTSDKPAIADTKLRFIECASDEEAYFLCGLLNSHPSILYLYATATWVQTADYQASDISRLHLPHYDKSKSIHSSIVHASKKCHAAAAIQDCKGIRKGADLLNLAVMQLWDITDKEMRAIERALTDLGFASYELTPKISEDER